MSEVSEKNWYIVHTYSGFEKKVAESLQQRVQAYGLQDEIGEVLIPTEDVVEMRAGKKVVSSKRFFGEADAAHERRSRADSDAGPHGGRETEAEVHLRQGRPGAHQRRAVCRLQRLGGRSEHRQEHVEGDGDDLRPLDAGRIGFLAGRKALSRARPEAVSYGKKSSSNGEAPDRRR
jgi:hypothetical protein